MKQVGHFDSLFFVFLTECRHKSKMYIGKKMFTLKDQKGQRLRHIRGMPTSSA